jgi:hypothetical protein
MTLKEFLKQESDKWNAQAAQREAQRREWVESVTRLLDQIRQWLQEADTGGVLRQSAGTTTLREQRLGEYDAPTLTIGLGSHQVRVVPVARITVGTFGDPSYRSQGLVEITDGAYKYLLYRFADGGGERWLLVDDTDYSTAPFDKAHFEAALVKLF